jgi:hypothetical protein
MEEKETSGNISLFTTPLFLFFIAIFLFMALINGSKGLAVLSIVVFCMAGGAKLWTRFCLRKTEYRLTTDKTKVFPGEGSFWTSLPKTKNRSRCGSPLLSPTRGFRCVQRIFTAQRGEGSIMVPAGQVPVGYNSGKKRCV